MPRIKKEAPAAQSMLTAERELIAFFAKCTDEDLILQLEQRIDELMRRHPEAVTDDMLSAAKDRARSGTHPSTLDSLPVSIWQKVSNIILRATKFKARVEFNIYELIGKYEVANMNNGKLLQVKRITSERFDQTAFKEAEPALYERFKGKSSYPKISVKE